MRYLLTLAALALLAVPVLAQPGGYLDPVDCTNLLTVLERVLRSVVEGVPDPKLVSTVASAGVPGEVGARHRDAYGKLLDYLDYLRRATEGSLSPREARELAAELGILANELRGAVDRYRAKLVACSHDKALATALSLRVEQLLRRLVEEYVPSVAQLLLAQAYGGLAEVRLSREVYEAGELAEVVVRPLGEGVEVGGAYVATWPLLTRVSTITLLREGTEYVGRFRVPDLTTLSRYYSSVPARVALVVVVELLDSMGGSSYRAYAPLSIEFRRPRVTIEAPSALHLGEVLEVAVKSDGLYRARVGIEGVYTLNTTLLPGVNTFRFNTSKLNLTYGTHLVVVEVEPTEVSVGLVATKPFVVLPRVPRVEVRVPTFLVTVDGHATVEVVSKEGTSRVLRAVISVGGAVRGTYYFNGSLRARTFLTYLPVLYTEVSVTVVPELPGYEPYVARGVVVCVNPAASVAVGVASVLAVALLHGREREFTLLLTSAGRRRVTGATRNIRSAILGFSYRVSSRVAELYYATLRRLHLPLPEPYETLREHLSRLAVGSRLGEVLWRFLLMVERDLYSGRRQDYGEALRVSEEVLRSGG